MSEVHICHQGFSPESNSELSKHNTFIFKKMLEDNNFGLKDPHPIWTIKRLITLCSLIQETPKFQQKIFNTVRFTKTVKEILYSVLNDINDEIIMQIFWEEFKLIRAHLKNKFYESLETVYGSNPTSICKIKQDFKNVFKKNDIYLNDDKSMIENWNNYLIENDSKTNVECKICFGKKVDTALVHDSHTCVVCETCSSKISNTCPFCKQKIRVRNKLIL